MGSAQQIFKDLEKGIWKPFYLVVGEEPFQTDEILSRIKAFFVKDENAGNFNYEAWEGEGCDATELLSSLDTLPGLFDEEGALRLVVCQRFDKLSASGLEILEPYFKNPSSTTCFTMTASKADKRKSWYKKVEEMGVVVEVNEPYEREWPKWQAYFEKKIGKKIQGLGWERLVESSNHTLSVLWAEVQKAALFVGEKSEITTEDVLSLTTGSGTADVFAFADDVIHRRAFQAMRGYDNLLRNGENEIKILAILVRQFRMLDQCARLMRQGVTDGKTLAPKIGAHPFYVSKIQAQVKLYSETRLSETLDSLTECDYRLKTGSGTLFENFLTPFFERSHG